MHFLSCLWADLADTWVDGRVGHSYLATRWRPNQPPGLEGVAYWSIVLGKVEVALHMPSLCVNPTTYAAGNLHYVINFS